MPNVSLMLESGDNEDIFSDFKTGLLYNALSHREAAYIIVKGRF